MEFKRKRISRYKNQLAKLLFKKMTPRTKKMNKMHNSSLLRAHLGMNIQLTLKANRF